jgi:hypothetical protein
MKTTAVLIPIAENDEIPDNNGDISISHTVLSLMSQQVAQMYSAIPCAFDS